MSPLDDTLGRASPAVVRILIVDDDPGKRLALKAILASLHFVLVECDSGTAALRCVMEQEFAVILLDVRMPIMNGFETAALIRLRRQCEMTPIIFITAYGRDDLTDANLYAQGAVDFITSPVIPDELRAKVSVFANLFTRAEDLAARARLVQASADQLRFLTDAAPIGIFQTDAHDSYTYTNPHWSELTGISAEAALGAPWGSTLPTADEDGLTVHLDDTDIDRLQVSGRVEIKLPGSSSRFVVATSRAIPDGVGGIAGRVGVLADVTAEAAAEAVLSDARDKATEASQLKSDFLANTSHEIRTPMNGVIGMTELLLETELDPTQRDYAQTVRSSGEALLTVINDILDFSKIEAGMLEVETVECSLHAIVSDVVALLLESAQARGLKLLTVVATSLTDAVQGDPGRIRQVLMNLIGNAIKFTDSGEITVRIGSEGVGFLRCEVSDTGIGIPGDKLAGIFEPFVQADTSDSREYGGSGLGLAISSQLVQLMGGECGVSSNVGTGSTFWFTLGVAEVAPGARSSARSVQVASAAGSAPAGHARRPGGAGRLLLAEDNIVNQKVAVAMLTSEGYQVDTALNGAEALQALMAGSYDAILMDCQMPVMDGYEATLAIRSGRYGDRQIPILAITAGARVEDRNRCIEAGMDDYISKPISKDALIGLVALWVGRDLRPSGRAWDSEPLEQLRALATADDPRFIDELVDSFVQDVEPALAALRAGVGRGEAAAVARWAHFIAGSARQLGGRRLAASCGRLEERAADASFLDGHDDLDEIEADYEELRQILTCQCSTVN